MHSIIIIMDPMPQGHWLSCPQRAASGAPPPGRPGHPPERRGSDWVVQYPCDAALGPFARLRAG